mgnify:CR=1 FL=1
MVSKQLIPVGMCIIPWISSSNPAYYFIDNYLFSEIEHKHTIRYFNIFICIKIH